MHSFVVKICESVYDVRIMIFQMQQWQQQQQYSNRKLRYFTARLFDYIIFATVNGTQLMCQLSDCFVDKGQENQIRIQYNICTVNIMPETHTHTLTVRKQRIKQKQD